ncbi:MAG: universal stress protein [Acidobacteria bacterium]|nr:MAG: universal stress protein [Acidobacteriota bacterium]
MYKRILVAIEHSDADRAILAHVESLAKMTGAALVLVHVADGFAARHFDDLKLRESEEIHDDRAYLERLGRDLSAKGFTVETRLLMGTPSTELAKAVETEKVDLLAMATHGHRFLEDIMKGSTVDRVRHLVKVPVILVRQ